MSSENNEKKVVLKTMDEQNEPPKEAKEAEVNKPKKILRYSRTESIIKVVVVLVFSIFLLFFAFVLGMWTSDEGWVPLFNVDLFSLNSLGFLIIIWTVAVIVAEIIKSIIGRYNIMFAVTTLVGNVVIICTVGILFMQDNIMNQHFFVRLAQAFEGGIPAFVNLVLGNANLILLAIVFAVLVVETVKTWIKALRYK